MSHSREVKPFFAKVKAAGERTKSTPIFRSFSILASVCLLIGNCVTTWCRAKPAMQLIRDVPLTMRSSTAFLSPKET
jgi:hypothetical protein